MSHEAQSPQRAPLVPYQPAARSRASRWAQNAHPVATSAPVSASAAARGDSTSTPSSMAPPARALGVSQISPKPTRTARPRRIAPAQRPLASEEGEERLPVVFIEAREAVGVRPDPVGVARVGKLL